MSAILLSIVVLLAAAGIAFVNQRSFGRLPRGRAVGTYPPFAQLPRRAVPQPASYAADDFRQRVCGQHVGYSLREQRAPRTGVGASGAETRSAPFGAGGGCVGVVRPFVLSAAIGRGASSGRSGTDLQVADVAVLFSLQGYGRLFSGGHARYRLPDRHARPLGSSGLPYRNAVERAYRQGSLSAGRGGAFRVLGIRFRPDRRTGLERELRFVGRVPDPLPACAPFFRARVAAQPFALGLVFGGEPFAAGLSCRRRWLRCALRRDRPPVRADRPWRWWRTGSTTPTGVTFI